jgi:hypothetical protein
VHFWLTCCTKWNLTSKIGKLWKPNSWTETQYCLYKVKMHQPQVELDDISIVFIEVVTYLIANWPSNVNLKIVLKKLICWSGPELVNGGVRSGILSSLLLSYLWKVLCELTTGVGLPCWWTKRVQSSIGLRPEESTIPLRISR